MSDPNHFNNGINIIAVLNMCPKCNSGKPGKITFAHGGSCAYSFKCPHCGFLFSEIRTEVKSAISFAIKWFTKDPHGHYETSRCLQCQGLSSNRYISTVEFRDEADDQFTYKSICRVCLDSKDSTKGADLPQLLAFLSGPDFINRGRAAIRLRAFKDPCIAEPLIAALGDESEFVRDNAVITLGELKDIRAVAPLATMLRNPNLRTRIMAVQALGIIGDKCAFEPLSELLEFENIATENEIVKYVIEALGAIADPAAIPALTQFLDRLNREPSRLQYGVDPVILNYRIFAITALEKLRAVEALISLLSIPHAGCQRRVIDALGKTGDKRAARPLLNLLLQNNSMLLITDIARSLMAIGEGSSAVQPLVDLMSREQSAGILAAAINLLGDIGDARAVQPLIEIVLNSKLYSDTRIHAIRALGKLGDGRAVQPLIAALDSRDIIERKRAIVALGTLRDPRAIEALRKVLVAPDIVPNDDTLSLHHYASQAIQQLSDEK